MPFRSEAQRRYMHANEPEVAKEWERHTPKGKKLPKQVAKMSGDGAAYKHYRDKGYSADEADRLAGKMSDVPVELPMIGKYAGDDAFGSEVASLIGKATNGASPQFNTPELPDYQYIYNMPEGDPRLEEEREAAANRRRSTRQGASHPFRTFHGDPPTPELRAEDDDFASNAAKTREEQKPGSKKKDRKRLFKKAADVGAWAALHGLSAVVEPLRKGGGFAPLLKASKPPPGFMPVKGSKKGGYKKMIGGKWVYWYPGQPVPKAARKEAKKDISSDVLEAGRRSLQETIDKILQRGPIKDLSDKDLDKLQGLIHSSGGYATKEHRSIQAEASSELNRRRQARRNKQYEERTAKREEAILRRRAEEAEKKADRPKLTKTSPKEVLGALQRAGFKAAKKPKRGQEARSGVSVSKQNAALVGVEYEDWEDKGDRAEKMDAVIDALRGEGYNFFMMDGSHGEDAIRQGKRNGAILVSKGAEPDLPAFAKVSDGDVRLDFMQAASDQNLPKDKVVRWRDEILRNVQTGDEITVSGSKQDPDDTWYFYGKNDVRLNVTSISKNRIVGTSDGREVELKKQAGQPWRLHTKRTQEERRLGKHGGPSIDRVEELAIHSDDLKAFATDYISKEWKQEQSDRSAREEKAEQRRKEIAEREREDAEYERQAREEKEARDAARRKEQQEVKDRADDSPYKKAAQTKKYNKGVAWVGGKVDDPDRMMRLAAKKATGNPDASPKDIQAHDPFWFGVYKGAKAYKQTPTGKKEAKAKAKLESARAKLAGALHDKTDSDPKQREEMTKRFSAGIDWASKRGIAPEAAKKIAKKKVVAPRKKPKNDDEWLEHMYESDPFWAGVFQSAMKKSEGPRIVFRVGGVS